jgi:hypothetical protein
MLTEKKRLSHILILIGIGLFLTLPVIIYGFPYNSHDGVGHAIWAKNFTAQVWSGDLYPRWLLGMDGGLGSPAFFYYQPVPFYFASIFKPFFVSSDPDGWRLAGASASLGLIASGLCAYAWLQEITDRSSALYSAILYMAMPYHLAVDLYVRGAISEVWAFVWMPSILYFLHKIRNGSQLAFVGLAVSYALLIMSHLPTAFMFSIVLAGYVLLMADARWRLTILAFCSMLLGLGLSAIYWLPASLTQGYVALDEMKEVYKSHFLLTTLDWQQFVGQLSWIVIITTGLACCAYAISYSSKNKFRTLNTFWLITAAFSLFMMTPPSKPLWHWLSSVLWKIVFPWRFNTVLSIATISLLAASIPIINKPRRRLLITIRMIAMILLLSFVPITVWAAWRAYPVTYPIAGRTDLANKLQEQNSELSEYRPRWAQSVLKSGLDALLLRIGTSGESLSKVNIIEGRGSVAVERWKPREIILRVANEGEVLLQVSQFYYPGWTAQLINEPSSLIVLPSEPDGLLSISVPGGAHQVKLYLDELPTEHFGRIISTVSALATLGLCLWLLVARRVNRRDALSANRKGLKQGAA